jgi:hypothetical protein
MIRALSASELLNAWEWGSGQPPVERALTLLAAACPHTPREALAKLSIGRRDALLMTLREWTFGAQLSSLVPCPDCGEYLELNFSVADIRVTAEAEPPESLSLHADGYELHFRLPNSVDVTAITGSNGVAIARTALLERCLLSNHADEDAQPVDALPTTIVDKVMERMAEADPQADVQLALHCPTCAHEWQAAFDIVSFFWSEIAAWASRLLRDVHALASAYGWNESDILAMSPWRRQLYLEMVRA